MLLHDLIRRFDPALPLPTQNPDITVITEDSRCVQPGWLFVAREGSKATGTLFLIDAQTRGAAAVVTPTKSSELTIPQVQCISQSAASVLGQLFYGEPSKKFKVLAVTGTNGKTTTTYLLRHILGKLGVKCGLIGTVEIDNGKTRTEANLTTPAATDVARYMAEMVANGCRACAIETSSHALHQGRIAGVQFAAGAFTNLTGDHLDYHQTMDAYADAKAVLFRALPEDAVACVNAEDTYSPWMLKNCQARPVTWGFSEHANYAARDIAITSSGSHFVLVTPDGRTEVNMQLIGRHNIENALCAASVAGETFGLSVHQLASGLADALGAPGRLQPVRDGQPFAVLVDYAHTDDALENVLSALKPLTRGKLRVLFGCGGDRDPTKRPRMARVAEKLADVIYVTSDNPRTENSSRIIDAICTGFSADSGKKVVVEPDRRAAIDRVIADADPRDVVLLAGKGHENYQIVGTTKHHFDDVEEATRAIRAVSSTSRTA